MSNAFTARTLGYLLTRVNELAGDCWNEERPHNFLGFILACENLDESGGFGSIGSPKDGSCKVRCIDRMSRCLKLHLIVRV